MDTIPMPNVWAMEMALLMPMCAPRKPKELCPLTLFVLSVDKSKIKSER